MPDLRFTLRGKVEYSIYKLRVILKFRGRLCKIFPYYLYPLCHLIFLFQLWKKMFPHIELLYNKQVIITLYKQWFKQKLFIYRIKKKKKRKILKARLFFTRCKHGESPAREQGGGISKKYTSPEKVKNRPGN